MSIPRTIGSIVMTLLVGALTFFVASPRKSAKSKSRLAKTTVDKNVEEKDDLFI